MKEILTYRPKSLNAWSQHQERTSVIYKIEEKDIKSTLPNLMGYRQHLTITKHHVGKLCEITTYDSDSYQNSQIVSEEWLKHASKEHNSGVTHDSNTVKTG